MDIILEIAIVLVVCFLVWLEYRLEAIVGQATGERFVVAPSRHLFRIGAVGSLVMIAIMIGLTVSGQLQDLGSRWIFYSLFGALLCLELWMMIICIRCKIIVKGEEITVFAIVGKRYVFLFCDIVSVVRKANYVAQLGPESSNIDSTENEQAEQIVITTKYGKKLKVESSYVSYLKFVEKIKSKVPREKTTGFYF